ncbi:MAG: hypothetical protein ACI9TH_002747 [Kiritimatiellia bacterium]|jgi:hypothetical protein
MNLNTAKHHIVILAFLVCAGCGKDQLKTGVDGSLVTEKGTAYTEESLAAVITNGMPISAVHATFGQPFVVFDDGGGKKHLLYQTEYDYSIHSDEMFLSGFGVFTLNGKVTRWSPSYRSQR